MEVVKYQIKCERGVGFGEVGAGIGQGLKPRLPRNGALGFYVA
jgi:hypothetical protein